MRLRPITLIASNHCAKSPGGRAIAIRYNDSHRTTRSTVLVDCSKVTAHQDVDKFIDRWKQSGAAERANYALFLTQLCDVIGVPQPDPTTPDASKNAYVFERDVTFQSGDGSTSTGRIDLYKRGCFILEAKQGSDQDRAAEEAAHLLSPAAKSSKKKGTAVRGTKSWDDAMVRARGQAEAYAKALPTSEGWPPFLMVVDVGHVIELYSEFTCAGKAYVMFPDPQSFRIKLDDLRDEKIRQRLSTIWTDPRSLDPSRRSAKVTRELAQRLAELAKLLEKAGHDPALVARFLMRCLFTMFAEDVELIPRGSFKDLLESLREGPENFQPMAESLWETMNSGGFSPILRKKILRFNGGLFAECQALPLDKPMLALLIESAKSDWADVEPAIFGTLLERALDPRERHKLGAHFTPRAYVERLVLPTVIEPLRDEWKTVYAAAITHANKGELQEAREEVRQFHEKLCSIRILDPACGSGNFLYVTLEHMKRLEGEVLHALRELGEQQTLLSTHEVDPHQFLGIEINPRAAAIADLVLWIGYLQWHFRARGKSAPAEPIIRNFKNIECRDAVLAWDSVEEVRDEQGQLVTRWDGHTMKPHPATGEEVPDESARVSVVRYANSRKAEWPKADYVVGNPPFIGNWRMRQVLGDGYTEAIRATYPKVSENCDYVMYWWDRAAELTQQGELHRFGLITTNSLRQKFSRRVLEEYLEAEQPLSLDYAIPDHPWVDAAEGAAVRISMTVASRGLHDGLLERVTTETPCADGDVEVVMMPKVGPIHSDLSIGADVVGTGSLAANLGLSNTGVKLHGAGFLVTPAEAAAMGLGRIAGLEQHIRRYCNGKDLAQVSRQLMVIDLDGLEIESVRTQFPEVFQRVVERVKPERDQNNERYRREHWWLFGRRNTELRAALRNLNRFVATPETAKHRYFVFLDRDVLPDNMIIAIALEDAFHLGVLSCRIHVCWALAAGGRLGVGNDPRYNKSRCFEPFAFPIATVQQQSRIRKLGEQLDAHRKRQQSLHPDLTMTGMYNVLEKLRAGEPLNAKERKIHEDGLVSVLQQIHDDLDSAVFDAYGWPTTLTDEEILERLVALNAERAAEEARGIIRWLRPEFQSPSADAAKQGKLTLPDDDQAEPDKPEPAKEPKAAKTSKAPWPKERSQRSKAIQDALAASPGPVTPEELAKQFLRGKADQVEDVLEALCSLGMARRHRGRYTV